MEAALGLPRPLPSSGALVLAVCHRACARRAADREIAPSNERMLGEIVARDVCGDVGGGQRGDGVDADEMTVCLEDPDVAARAALIAAQQESGSRFWMSAPFFAT